MSNQVGIDFNKELKLLKERGPESLYLIYGIEDYLREMYVSEIRSLCVDNSAFGYYLFDEIPDANTLSSAIDTIPFLSDKSLIELKNCNINKVSDDILEVLKSIPDYATVVITCKSDFEPDNRTKSVKFFNANAKVLNFSVQDDSKLISWIIKRFKSNNKLIGKDAAERLLFVSGNRMSVLIPEINKISGTAGDEITVDHINCLANHIPEADAFEIVNLISDKKFDAAIKSLSDFLAQKNMEPIMIISAFSYQFRQLYGAKIGVLNNKFDFRSKSILSTSKKFTIKQIKACTNICVDYEYLFKSSMFTDLDIIKTMVVKIIAEIY